MLVLAKRLGEQCFYDLACLHNDENSVCMQINHNAICDCREGWHSVTHLKPTRRTFCTQGKFYRQSMSARKHTSATCTRSIPLSINYFGNNRLLCHYPIMRSYYVRLYDNCVRPAYSAWRYHRHFHACWSHLHGFASLQQNEISQDTDVCRCACRAACILCQWHRWLLYTYSWSFMTKSLTHHRNSIDDTIKSTVIEVEWPFNGINWFVRRETVIGNFTQGCKCVAITTR